MKLINGNGRSARLIGMEVVGVISKMAKKTGIAMVGIYNSTYHGILETYTRQIAANDLIGIVMANGGPSGVVPFGGRKSIFGTNPISYGIPSNDLPIVFDAATAKYPYGTIRRARSKGIKLPKNCYLDKEGNYTVDPKKAVSIIPFGEHKGYAINLLIEIMTGVLVNTKMGLESTGASDLGSVFIAIDPNFFVPIKQFKAQISQLIKDIKEVKPVKGVDIVYVPGHHGEEEKIRMLKQGYIEVNDDIWRKFEEIYRKRV